MTKYDNVSMLLKNGLLAATQRQRYRDMSVQKPSCRKTSLIERPKFRQRMRSLAEYGQY
jgi:hypothetical protein